MDLFIQLHQHFGPSIPVDRKGEVWTDCPFCKRQGKHFSFSERGYHCFGCGKSGSLRDLAEQERIERQMGYQRPEVIVRRQRPAPAWAAKGIVRYLTSPERYDRWQAYKPISWESIDKYNLGYGKLPFEGDRGWYESKNDWLVVPLFERSELVGLRGRNTGTEGPKWISATGSRYTLWNIGNARPGHQLWIMENYIDAIMLMERYPEWDAVAIGGASTWQEGWIDKVRAARPSHVVVALDNDLAGQATGAMYDKLAAEWKLERPGVPVPSPNGPKIANMLRAAHVPATLYRWPAEAPAKADIGWKLMQQEEQTWKTN